MTSTTARAFERLSAVTAGVKDVREVIARAEDRLGQQGRRTILFLDEVHRFNKSQQDALLPAGRVGPARAHRRHHREPLLRGQPAAASAARPCSGSSRSGPDAIAHARRAGPATRRGRRPIADAVALLVERSAGDGRHALTSLEVAVALAGERGGPPVVTVGDVEQALGTKALRYGRDDHYDVISAFIKSIRGSDPDAGLYWLARMLEAGEDARFIARRLVILASEDVGLADPMSLLVADAAARAVEFVGLPEAQLNLAQAVVHLATAPKSNRSALGIWRARQAVQETGGQGEVPIHLRDAHYGGARSLGHGEGYLYPHDDPTGWVPQQYRPPEVGDAVYYEPSTHGYEAEIGRRQAGTAAPSGRRGRPPGAAVVTAGDLAVVLAGCGRAWGCAPRRWRCGSRCGRRPPSCAALIDASATAVDEARASADAARGEVERIEAPAGPQRGGGRPGRRRQRARLRHLLPPGHQGDGGRGRDPPGRPAPPQPRRRGARTPGTPMIRRLFWLVVGAVAGGLVTVYTLAGIRQARTHLDPQTVPARVAHAGRPGRPGGRATPGRGCAPPSTRVGRLATSTSHGPPAVTSGGACPTSSEPVRAPPVDR